MTPIVRSIHGVKVYAGDRIQFVKEVEGHHVTLHPEACTVLELRGSLWFVQQDGDSGELTGLAPFIILAPFAHPHRHTTV